MKWKIARSDVLSVTLIGLLIIILAGPALASDVNT